jgi:O-antigen/teichoic acid export membrane protein
MSMEPHDPEEYSSELAPARMLAEASGAWRKRGRRVVQVGTSFVLGQGATQGINALAGFYLVHKLSIEAYAQFGLAMGFQTVFSVLMDLGFAGTIIPLVGERRDDRALVGRYIRSAELMRNRLFALLAPVAAAAFLWTVHRHHWSWKVQILLMISVLVSLYSGGKASYFATPLYLFGRMREYYVPQVLSVTGRLFAYVGLTLAGALNGWTAAGLTALNITVNGRYIRKASEKYLIWPAQESPETDREMLRYILPASPAIIFSAFQSQISLFLVSIFGGGNLFIAEVTALSRIGQLFLVLMTFNTIVVEPYIARLGRDRLLRTYWGILLLATVTCIPIALIGFRWPGAFLWILGMKYEGVRDLMGLYVLSCCMNFVSGTIWIMNRGRKWVFWSGSIVEVVLLIGVQMAFLLLVGVHNTRDAVLFNLASSVCYLLAHGYVSVYGFWKGPRVEASAS